MRESRTAIVKSDVTSGPAPVARKGKGRGQAAEPSLVDIAIPRKERRTTNHRAEDRFPGVVDRATLVFRRK